jgi:hypothetical protein
VDSRPHLFPAWATLPHRETRQRRVGVRRARSEWVGCARAGIGWVGGGRTGWVWRAGIGWVGGGRGGWVHRTLDDVVECCGVVGHGGSLA